MSDQLCLICGDKLKQKSITGIFVCLKETKIGYENNINHYILERDIILMTSIERIYYDIWYFYIINGITSLWKNNNVNGGSDQPNWNWKQIIELPIIFTDWSDPIKNAQRMKDFVVFS